MLTIVGVLAQQSATWRGQALEMTNFDGVWIKQLLQGLRCHVEVRVRKAHRGLLGFEQGSSLDAPGAIDDGS